MTHAITFDTLAYAKRLIAVGVPAQQAEALAEVINEGLVSKQYLDLRLQELKYDLTIRMGAMFAATITILATLVKLL